MPTTYLLIWNPKRWPWSGDDIDAAIADLASGNAVRRSWSTGRTKRARPGDRFYLMRVGDPPRGIFGSGRIVSEVRETEHWDSARAANGDRHLEVDIELDRLLNPHTQAALGQEVLVARLPDLTWTPQASGMTIPETAEAQLAELWKRHLENDAAIPSDDYHEGKKLFEELLPDADLRRTILTRVRESIAHAHAQGVSNWDLTRRKRGFRLNSGCVQALWLHRGERRGLILGDPVAHPARQHEPRPLERVAQIRIRAQQRTLESLPAKLRLVDRIQKQPARLAETLGKSDPPLLVKSA